MAEYVTNEIPAQKKCLKIVPRQIVLNGLDLDYGQCVMNFNNVGRLVDPETKEPVLDATGNKIYEVVPEFSTFKVNLMDHVTKEFEVTNLSGETRTISVYECINLFGQLFDVIYDEIIEAKNAKEEQETEGADDETTEG